MAILITGAAGYIGSHTAYSFIDSGKEIVIIDRLSSGERPHFPENIPFYHGDFTDDALMETVFTKHDIDTVIHFAGSVIVPESVVNPLKYYQDNTLATQKLLTMCVQHNVKNFIFSSTAAVYGTNPLQLMKEEYPLNPENPYAASKLACEWIIKDVSKAHGMNYVILRYFNVAGADPKGRIGQTTKNATLLIKVACEVATGKRPVLKVFGTDYDTKDGSCIRDFIHVSDVADAHVKVYDYMQSGNGRRIFNCGNGDGYSVLEIIEAIERISGKKLNVEYCPRREGDPVALTADSTKLQLETGWKPQYTNLDDIIGSALAWERKLA
jgi:UDP-glucose 4-epimerase